MIKFNNSDKVLTVPSGLGNFGYSGGGTGGGVTEEEVIEIVNSAITEYDAEIQVDLEVINDNVSANTENIEGLSGATVANDQNIADLSGATENIQSNVNALSGATENIQSNVNSLSGSVVTLTENLNSLSSKTETAITDIASVSADTSTNASNIEALSAATSGIAVSVETLSGRIKDTFLWDVAAFEDMEYPERKTYWDQAYAKLASGCTIVAFAYEVNKTDKIILLPLERYQAETTPSTHSGGWLYFVGKSEAANKYYKYTVSSGGNVSGVGSSGANLKKFQSYDIYSLPTASQSTIGGVKVGSGLTISSDKLSVNIGEGLAYSGNTIVVSGGTGGGGIEKVQSLPQNPEEGTIVLLEIPEFTVTTVSTNMDEKDWEAGMTVAVVGNDGVDYQGYGQNFAKWNVINSTLSCRFRKDDNNNLLTDITADAADVTISEGESMTENNVPSYYELWEFKEGMWRQIDREWRFEIGKDGSAGDLYWQLYSGLTNDNPENLIIKYEGRDYVPMASRYYGMDCNTTDGRGSSPDDPVRISIVCRRLADWGFGEFYGSQSTATQDDINSVRIWIGQCAFGNQNRGGLTYDADNDRFVYDSQNWATGDTSNVLEDLVDYNLTINGLLTRDGRYGNFYCENAFTFYVISGGTTTTYTTPIIAKKDITNYTVGGDTFKWELTFNYGDWKLKVDVPESNAGINLRIASV